MEQYWQAMLQLYRIDQQVYLLLRCVLYEVWLYMNFWIIILSMSSSNGKGFAIIGIG